MPFLQDSKLLQTNVPLGELLGIEYYGIPDLRICRSLLNVSLISVITEKDVPTVIPDIQTKVLKKVVEIVDNG